MKKHNQLDFEKITLNEYVREKNDFDLHEFKRDFYTYTYNKRMALVSNLNIYLGIGCMLLLVLSGFVIYDQVLYRTDISKNVEIKALAMDIVTPETQEVLAAAFGPSQAGTAPDEAGNPGLPEEPILSYDKDAYEEEDQPREINAAIRRLRTELGNDDIIAYLSIPGTDIHYPVVQSGDNDYYLTHDLSGDSNVAGSIFLDFDNNNDFTGKNSIIYGHNMRDGSMFHNLRYYKDEIFFQENDIIELTTVDGFTQWQIFSFFETGTDFNYIQTRFLDNDHALRLFTAMKEMSLYDSGVNLKRSDTVLTLSTCTNRYDDSRYVVAAIKIQ